MNDKKQDLDYSLLCRTCLQSNGEMLFLSAFIKDNFKEQSSKISYLECLKMCIQFEEIPNLKMPQRICLECASTLQVSYWFMKNAMQAQDLLKLKLAEFERKKQLHEMEVSADIMKPKRYRCKICNVRVETKRSLKDHVKLHLDIIVYNCQFCSFESHNRSSLGDHYIHIHGVEATREQLKPTTKLSLTTSFSRKFSNQDRGDGAINSDLFRILPEETGQNSSEQLANDSLCDVSPPHVSNHNVNSNYNAISASFNTELKNDLNVVNEFTVAADEGIEKVVSKEVVIEYIDSENNSCNLNVGNGLVLDNTMVHAQNIDSSPMLGQENDIGQMDVNDLIIEDPVEAVEETQVVENVILPLAEEIIPAAIIEQPKKIMCKICTKDFSTQEQLKNHMLTHNEIPHFFCDQCKFYTFFKIDLHQHYKSKHNLQPTNKQLQPKNKQKAFNQFYACDLCFYESETKFDIKKHYKVKHNIEANEIHLKPTKVERIKSKFSPLTAKAKAAAIVTKSTTAETIKNVEMHSGEEPTPDYPNGLNCRKCQKIFYWRKKLYEHYKMHSAEEASLKQAKQIVKVQLKPTSLNPSPDKTKNMRVPLNLTSKTVQSQLNTASTASFSGLGTLALSVPTANVDTLNSVAPLTPSSSSTYTLPSDAVPQIVETDQTIENVMDFAFNCDDDASLFEDFDDDVDVENNSDENDSEFRNILLTSDDDFEDILQGQKNANNVSSNLATSRQFCPHCQKPFLSQYQFENHMFVHRGLAPYRCEMCTNLYNTKRSLIRHYKAVHKNIPTRDMIQAKGDKVCDDKISIKNLKLEPTTCFMCGKCPYESSDLNNLNSHMKSSHNIENEAFIIKKLPFECPRCIRSFENKTMLLRHLERNHSLIPIDQAQNIFDCGKGTEAAIATTVSVTSITTTINNHVNMMQTETIETNASCGYSDFFIKKEQQQQKHQNACSDAVTHHHIIITPLEESTTPAQHLANNNETSSNSTNSVADMPNTSKEFVASHPITAITLSESDKGQPLFKCKACFLTCYDLANFNEHGKRIECRKVEDCSPGNRMLFECEICHCNYKTMYLLKHHLKRHIGRKFLCADCPKSFINKVELKAHKYVHSGERPHKCDSCSKSFRYVHHLKRHKDSVHYGKRHACTVPNCNRKFTTLAQLKLHLWTHNGIVPYKCPFCKRVFKKRLLLREHCSKIHYVNLSEEEMAKIFRNSLGYTNPHDFTVTIGNGKMLRRGDLETMGASGVIQCSFK